MDDLQTLISQANTLLTQAKVLVNKHKEQKERAEDLDELNNKGIQDND